MLNSGHSADSLPLVEQLKQAIDSNNLEQVKQLMAAHPTLHQSPLGYGGNGPLTWVAECRVPREAPSETRLLMARWMIENGSDIHQGGDGPLMRAALSDSRIPMMELLVAHGGNVNALWNGTYPIVHAPCETLAPQALKWLLDHGVNLQTPGQDPGSLFRMLVCTYARNAKGRSACLEVLAAAGADLPDTPMMAFHRGRLDLLESHLQREPSLLDRRFTTEEIFPPAPGVEAEEGLHVTPVSGGTLLHLAVEYDDLDAARWLLDRGANANTQAAVDADRFGGHTPIFHAVVTLAPHDDAMARLLLAQGANPNARATFRKQLRDMGDPEKERMREFRDVSPVGYAHQFQEQRWVNEPALAAIIEYGGKE